MVTLELSRHQIILLIAGFIFGFALQHGRVHELSIVIGQMTFSHMVMLKMFMSALGTSLLVSSAYFRGDLKNCDGTQVTQLWEKPRPYAHIVLGAAILGFGMTLSGSCPGTIYSQIGGLSPTSFIVFSGAILGALAWSLIAQRIPEKLTKFSNLLIMSPSNSSLHMISNRLSKSALTPHEFSFVAGSILLIFVTILEVIFPWRSDLSGVSKDPYSLMIIIDILPPVASGALVGLSQFVLTSLLNLRLGSSASFEAYIGRISLLLSSYIPQFKNHVLPHIPQNLIDASNNPQIFTSIGTIIGAFIGTILSRSLYVGLYASDYSLGYASIPSLLRLFIGGFLITFGARCAGGCTAGHGISGLSHLHTVCGIATCAMFGMAIVSGIIFKIIGF